MRDRNDGFHYAAIRIQTSFRGYRVRKRTVWKLRQDIEALMEEMDSEFNISCMLLGFPKPQKLLSWGRSGHASFQLPIIQDIFFGSRSTYPFPPFTSTDGELRTRVIEKAKDTTDILVQQDYQQIPLMQKQNSPLQGRDTGEAIGKICIPQHRELDVEDIHKDSLETGAVNDVQFELIESHNTDLTEDVADSEVRVNDFKEASGDRTLANESGDHGEIVDSVVRVNDFKEASGDRTLANESGDHGEIVDNEARVNDFKEVSGDRILVNASGNHGEVEDNEDLVNDYNEASSDRTLVNQSGDHGGVADNDALVDAFNIASNDRTLVNQSGDNGEAADNDALVDAFNIASNDRTLVNQSGDDGEAADNDALVDDFNIASSDRTLVNQSGDHCEVAESHCIVKDFQAVSVDQSSIHDVRELCEVGEIESVVNDPPQFNMPSNAKSEDIHEIPGDMSEGEQFVNNLATTSNTPVKSQSSNSDNIELMLQSDESLIEQITLTHTGPEIEQELEWARQALADRLNYLRRQHIQR